VQPDGTKVDEIAVGGWRLDENGMLQIPDPPGLGLTLDRDALARYTDGELRL
jgi:L-alanine-DL-glutamate epimerase-like enolase superfamily enzyme